MELQGPLSNSWKRAEELFLAAADMPETEQREFVTRECRGNEALRAEVESLLAPDPYVGERFGAYRALREIGHGRMATVYLAVRDDDQYRKSVAVNAAKAHLAVRSHLR